MTISDEHEANGGEGRELAEVRIAFARANIFFIFMLSMMFVTMLALALFDMQRKGDYSSYAVVGVVCMAFFAIVAYELALKLWPWRAALVINAEGIVDNASYMRPGFIPWCDVKNVRLEDLRMHKRRTELHKLTVLEINVRNFERYYKQANVVGKIFAKLNRRYFGGHIYIDASTLAASPQDLRDVLGAYTQLK